MTRRDRLLRLQPQRPELTLGDPGEAITFRIRAGDGELYVERESIGPSGARRIVAAAFRRPDEFLRWCDADASRFASPLAHSRARKEGLAILARIAANSTTP